MSEDTAPLRASTADDGPPPSTTIAKVRRCLCILATIFFIVLLAAAIVVLALLLVFVGQQPARVVTDCGVVEGNFDPINKVFSFKVSKRGLNWDIFVRSFKWILSFD